jgi:outer membrane protein assembly factor BamD
MFRPPMNALRPLALAGLLALAACAGSRTSFGGEVKYGATAEENYGFGLKALERSDWVEAQKLLEHVRTKYPFSKYAPLAELRLADIKVSQDRLLEAAEAYASFVKMHPSHEEADYAAFREAEALFKDAPTDFFLFPPAHERELKSLRDAAVKLEALPKRWPESKHRAAAEKLLAQARVQLAEHEWYAAEFYARRGRWAGAAGRYEALVKTFPGSKHEVDALFAMADAYLKMDDKFKARQALQRLISSHPDDPRRPQAEQRLAALR